MTPPLSSHRGAFATPWILKIGLFEILLVFSSKWNSIIYFVIPEQIYLDAIKGTHMIIVNILMIFPHNNPHLWVQTAFMPLWLYSVASNDLEKWCKHQTTFLKTLQSFNSPD